MASQSTRFAVGIHILALLELCREEQRCTSEFIAGSVGTNPVVVRRITKLLANAGLLRVHAGVGGAELARPPDKIRLLDVYRAVASGRDGGLFGIHEHPHPKCPVGATIQASLEAVFADAQRAAETVLRDRTLKDVVNDLQRRGSTG